MPKSLATRLSMLIGHTYDATRDPTQWRKFLKAFVSCFPGLAASLEVVRYAQQEVPFFLQEGYPPGAVEDWFANHAKDCPWLPIQRQSALDDPFDLDDRYARGDLEQSSFYKNWCMPYGFGSCFSVKVYDDADGYAMLVADCAPDIAPSIKPELLELMRLLSPHIRRSLEMRSTLRDRRERAMRDLVGVSAGPVLILDSEGGILFANASAEAALKQKAFISRKPNGGLALPGVPSMKRATDALALAGEPAGDEDGKRALLPCKSVVDGTLGVIEIVRLRIRSVPLAGDVPFGEKSDGPCYRLSVRTQWPATLPTADELKSGLALSSTEANLVAGLIEGASPKTLASIHGKTIDGVKWHFRNIYEKLGCRSQAELVSIVLALLHL